MHCSRLRCSLFPALLALLFCSRGSVAAQTPSPGQPAPTPQNTATQNTTPQNAAPTPVAPGSLPSMPPPTPVPPSEPPPSPNTTGQVPAMPAPAPAQTPATPGQTPPQPYRDPLEQPIVVAPPTPGSPAAPVVVDMPSPATAASLPSFPDFDVPDEQPAHTDALGSTYIPVDSPIYPMALRLYSLGYLGTEFIGMRPWTRRSLLHALNETSSEVMASSDDQAIPILARLQELLQAEVPPKGEGRGRVEGLESAYTRFMGISGTPLRDSYHLGQTISDDYGRPYQHGFNNVTGFSSVNEWGRFSLYVRGEYQHAPAAAGYSTALSATISQIDEINYLQPGGFQLHQDTIPTGPIAAANPFRLQEVALSYHLLGHEISFGKQDAWLGPDYGGAMAWSDNAENPYSFRINRIEPMHIPYFSRIFGPLRYDFFVGPLQGHSAPNAPWVHQEILSISPTSSFQIAVQRTAIWGGHGHGCLNPDGSINPCTEPITIHTFLKSFFSLSDTTPAEKYSRDDPGARFTSFTFSWRLPYLKKSLTLYTDSTTHDDVNPISAPRRAGWRPGLYLSHIPGAPRFDLRVEGDYTDYVTLRSVGGLGNYFEAIQLQGYTSKGFIMGDWIGREGKGGQAWLTYHLSPDDFIQLEYMHKKTDKDFIPLGTTQNQVKAEFQKRIGHDFEADAWVQYEKWMAPVYLPGAQTDVTGAVQVTWYPKLRTARSLDGGTTKGGNGYK